jgi:catechol 2,3-dioxygenase-like lactoylglutathione lyase family enzyme
MSGGPDTRLDHVAIGMDRIADATDFIVGRLGGRAESGGPGSGFRWACWRFDGGGRIEVIEPAGADGFLHRFLAARGPGIHHVTFKVRSLAKAITRAEALGYRVVGRDESDPDWIVAYLHPKEALGIVVQLGQSGSRSGRRPTEVPAGPPDPPAAARVLGLRTRVRSAERARLQWERALGGTATHAPENALAFHWTGSPMRIVAEIAPDAEEGPVAIELGPDPAVPGGLPSGPVAPLGTVFVVPQRRPEA